MTNTIFNPRLPWHRRLCSRIGDRWALFRRRWIPYLVWWGQEIDVQVTFKENRLQPVEATSMEAMFQAGAGQLFRGSFYKAEQHIKECGISFDTGMSPEGRDWSWDWSLKGPISVSFRGPSSHPERRV